jgi:hypothetical protein
MRFDRQQIHVQSFICVSALLFGSKINFKMLLLALSVLYIFLLGYGLDGPGFRSKQTFLFSETSTSSLGCTQPPIQCILGTFFPGVKELEHKAGHLFPSSAKVNFVPLNLNLCVYAFVVWFRYSCREN